MKIDSVGQISYNIDELVDVLYANPDVNLLRFPVDNPSQYNSAVAQTYAGFTAIPAYQPFTGSAEDFDLANQNIWLMSEKYKQLDVAKFILDRCQTEAELQRCGEELLLFQERDMFNLLRWLVYFVDTMRSNNIVWGVGRGSSVASYVLYLIGVHKINSLYYDLDITEFLK